MSTNAISPYLAFDGNCREAMTFYRDAIGGKLEFMTFEQMPEEHPVPDEYKDRIMHCALRGEGLELMASDSMPGQGEPLVNGNTVSLSIATKELEKGRNIFDNLSSGGEVTMEFQPVFWGGNFGMLRDRYGMNWMITSEEQSEKVESESSEASA